MGQNVKPPIAIFRQTKPWMKQQPTSQLEKKPSSNCCWNCCKFSWQAASFYRDKALYNVAYLILGWFVSIDSQSQSPQYKSNPSLPEIFSESFSLLYAIQTPTLTTLTTGHESPTFSSWSWFSTHLPPHLEKALILHIGPWLSWL